MFRFLRSPLSAAMLALCTLWVVVGLSRSPAAAQLPINRAEIVQILDGSEVFIQNKQAKVKDAANKGQRVRTADARAQLLFNTGAVGRLSKQSVLTVGQCARLQKGTLLVNGAMNGCTSSVLAGVRGTTYILEVNDQGETAVKVLEGEVTVTKPTAAQLEEGSPPDQSKQLPGGKPDALVLKAGEQVSVNARGVPSGIVRISQEEFIKLLTSALFKDFTAPLPGMSKIQGSFRNLFPGVPFPISLPNVPGVPGGPGLPGGPSIPAPPRLF